jgi:serine/threonine-protein kinase
MTHEYEHEYEQEFEPEHTGETSETGETANESGGLTGQMLGGYMLGTLLGAGGMAEVYRAFDPGLDREVAVKVLPAPRAADAGYVARFREEARRVAALKHPHIVPIYAFGEERGLLYHVMPIVPETLRDRMKRESPLAPDEAVRLVLQIASALEAAHAHGLVHRDVKPENVLLTPEGDALLTDFGIARDLASLRKSGTMPTLSATGLPVGTPQYMAPEQLRGDVLDQRADEYALGAVLYELLTGQVPFDDETPYSVAVLVLTAPLVPPATLNPRVWPALDQAVLTALARDADARYPDMHRFAQALLEAVERPHLFAGAEDTTVPVGPVPLGALAFGPSDHSSGNVMTRGILWSAARWSRGAGAALRRRLSQDPPWRKQALLAALLLLLLVGLATSGTLIARGGAPWAFGIGSRPTPSDTTEPIATGPAASTTPGQSAATTTITITITSTVARSTATVFVSGTATARAGATATATAAATATATATATPPTLTLNPPMNLVLTRPQGQTKCSATQTITNNTGLTVGWSWQPPTQGGMSFQVNNQAPVGWPKDTTPGILPGGHDTLVATSDCKTPPVSFAVLLTTTPQGDQYTFIVKILSS